MERRVATVVVGLAVFILAREAVGQGAAVYSHGTCTTARAGAAVADPCQDGSAVFYNPAGVATERGALSIGISRISLTSRFRFDDPERVGSRTINEPIGVPHLFATYPLGRLAIGVGAWAPYGLEMKWPLGFEGRFVGYDNRLRSVYVQPTIAYDVVPGRFAVGGGLAIVNTRLDIRRRLDAADVPVPSRPFAFRRSVARAVPGLPVPEGTDYADADLLVEDWAATWHLGVLVVVTDELALGARYLSGTSLDLEGRAIFRPVPTGIILPADNALGLPAGTPLDAVLAPLFGTGGPLVEQSLATGLGLPAQFVVGIHLTPVPRVQLLADYQWTEWSTFDRAILRFQVAPDDTLHLGWRETGTWRAGAEFEARNDIMLRAGFAYNNAATPDNGVTPLLPEAERYTWTGGFGHDITRRLRVAGALEYAAQGSRRGRVRLVEDPDAPAASVNIGEYDGHAWVSALTLTYSLGPDDRPSVAVPPPP